MDIPRPDMESALKAYSHHEVVPEVRDIKSKSRLANIAADTINYWHETFGIDLSGKKLQDFMIRHAQRMFAVAPSPNENSLQKSAYLAPHIWRQYYMNLVIATLRNPLKIDPQPFSAELAMKYVSGRVIQQSTLPSVVIPGVEHIKQHASHLLGKTDRRTKQSSSWTFPSYVVLNLAGQIERSYLCVMPDSHNLILPNLEHVLKGHMDLREAHPELFSLENRPVAIVTPAEVIPDFGKVIENTQEIHRDRVVLSNFQLDQTAGEFYRFGGAAITRDPIIYTNHLPAPHQDNPTLAFRGLPLASAAAYLQEFYYKEVVQNKKR